MSQAPLFMAIFALGLTACFAVGPYGRSSLACALAFPVGLAMTVCTALLLLALSIPYRGWTLGLAVGLEAAGFAYVVMRRGLARPAVITIALWSLTFASISLVLSHRNFALMSYDSHQLVMLGGVLARDGAFARGTLEQLNGYGVFQVLAQSLSIFTHQDYLFSLAPVFGASFVALFAVTLWHGIRALDFARAPGDRKLTPLVGLFTASMFTIYLFAYHFVYIHTNLGAALYVFAFVTLFWLAEVTRDPQLLPLAFLCLLALALQRVEAPVFALICLCLTVLGTDLPRRRVTPWVAAFTLAVTGWYLLLATGVSAGSEFLTPERCYKVSGGVLAFLAYYLLSGRPLVRRLNAHAPWLLAVGCALALLLAFRQRPEHMLESAVAWKRNLLELPHWGFSWWFIAALVLLSLLLPAPRFGAVFTVGTVVHLGSILLLAMGRVPYRFSEGDSANRMTLHVLPVLFFYLALRLSPSVLAEPVEPTPTAT